ncbi:heme/hemin ABC transporter substrate-binding protein [Edwardsiella piscicida]|uniref:Periplasmic hemin-binding protein n=3 Tax=Edwardsiella TaxID=635 RepID=A0A0H3DUX0_EDWTF|nr:hemin ABC transporter substrate-binding protein [Edwardsiella piscicida]ACY84636.1 hemin-binding periplasmic protein [Edwardsiella tarda EIB202]ADM41734.1 Periplasmic hemin-binding protein [Edwardsiella tarda FL6-60]ARD19873.1 hemin ABC transporter substrate-binding protein [Edwardsiella piscicida]ELM3657341.1 hemin ABC transporter substrate-binding protein [Edwardsiella piscicida]ELM3734991.1 hemin ABC transporter substrate-binding protein [Edwardsiella piscicida]
MTRITSAILLLALCSVGARAGERLITLGGDVTEIVFALGAGDQVVARDSTSTQPAAAAALPDVGYMRQLNAEGILALKPTRVLASDQAQPAIALSQISEVGVTVVPVTSVNRLDAVDDKIHRLASALGREAQGQALIEDYRRRLAAIPRSPLNTRVLFILSHSGMTPMAAGGQTAADAIIRAAGGQNAMQGFNRYRPLSQEGVIAAQPDLILISHDGAKALGGPARVWALPGMAQTPAAREKRVLVLDDMALLGFTLGTPDALAALRSAAEQAQRP